MALVPNQDAITLKLSALSSGSLDGRTPMALLLKVVHFRVYPAIDHFQLPAQRNATTLQVGPKAIATTPTGTGSQNHSGTGGGHNMRDRRARKVSGNSSYARLLTALGVVLSLLPTSSGSGSCAPTCFGYSCDVLISSGQTCEYSESTMGCDCSGCSCDGDSSGSGSCAPTCNGYTCDEWVLWGTGDTCESLESIVGCDCSGCSCYVFSSLTYYLTAHLGNCYDPVGEDCSCSHIGFSGHMITGTIPTELSACTDLFELDLHGNSLTGTIPAELSACTGLSGLRLSSNSLTGTLPPELSTMISLGTLEINSNQLTGTLPPEFSTMISLGSLKLNSNQLIGTLPPEFSEFSNYLSILRLEHNRLTGSIPAEFSELTMLWELCVP